MLCFCRRFLPVEEAACRWAVLFTGNRAWSFYMAEAWGAATVQGTVLAVAVTNIISLQIPSITRISVRKMYLTMIP